MAITDSIGYAGSVTWADLALWRRAFAASYGVVGAEDWKVTIKPGVDRTLRAAAGVGFGHGVVDTNDTNETGATVALDPLASGARWDLIVARRDASETETTFTQVTGTSVQTAAFASREQEPGVLDDQPLALVRVVGNGGGGTIDATNVVDLRVWSVGGILHARSELVMQYLTDVGTNIWIGADLWHRGLDLITGSAAWRRVTVDPTYVAYTPTFAGFALGTGAGGGTVASRVRKDGTQVHYAGLVTLGAASVGSGSPADPIRMSLPYPAAYTALPVGSASLTDVSGGAHYPATPALWSNTVFLLRGVNGGNMTMINPITFAAGDSFGWNLTYETTP